IISAVLTAPMPPEPLAQEHTPPTTESAPIRALIAALLNRDVEQRPDPDQALELLERERETARGQAAPFPTAPPRSPSKAGTSGNPTQTPTMGHSTGGVPPPTGGAHPPFRAPLPVPPGPHTPHPPSRPSPPPPPRRAPPPRSRPPAPPGPPPPDRKPPPPPGRRPPGPPAGTHPPAPPPAGPRRPPGTPAPPTSSRPTPR